LIIKILLIEGDNVEEKTLIEFIEEKRLQETYEVVSSVNKAKELIENNKFDVILCDISIAEKNETELIDTLNNLPILIITGKNNNEIINPLKRIENNLYKEEYRTQIDYTKKEFSIFSHALRHDLRNYVSAIEGFTYLLKEDYDQMYLDRIFKNVRNIIELMDRSVNYADADSKIKKANQINLDKRFEKLAKKIVPASIKFTCEPLTTIKADYERINLVLKIILENAVIHGNPEWIKIQGKFKENGDYNLSITNNGEKIVLEKLMRIFTQPNSHKTKSGLGLATVKKILKVHRCDIQVVTDLYTSFEISIPQASIIT
jgi:signal transduction histidine kinase